ncbi:MAG TPA: YfbU family protein [Allosphingosinicella sp.]|nr:YfbU family protein [Allosphingosinicella sp.]
METKAERGSKSERFEMRLEARMIERLDRWREAQEDPPSRAEAVRRLVEAGLASTRRELVLGDGEKLLLAMVSDIYARTVPDGEFDPGFVQSALYGGHYWGLEWRLSGLFHGHVDNPAVVSEVVNILDMWSYVESSFGRLPADAQVRVEKSVGDDRTMFRFDGFDGNYESEHMSVARFMIEDLGRFSSFQGREINSHYPVLDRYRRQYLAFEPIRARSMGKPLSAADLIEILRER